MHKILETAKRLVIKIGTAHIIDRRSNTLRTSWLDSLVDDIVMLRQQGKEVLIVSSGAVPLGASSLGLSSNKLKLLEKQAASCCGQIELIEAFRKSFERHRIPIAQSLLTIEDAENRKHFMSVRNVFNSLLKKGVVPIVNENDTIATAEIRFGDNDRLSARVAQMAEAHLLVLLANVDGLYTADPHLNKNVSFVPEVFDVSTEVEKMAMDSPLGTGGMSAKVAAAKITLNTKCPTVITSGLADNPIKLLMNGIKATWFIFSENSHQKYKIETKRQA
jgi:glutamate 5-kinase